MIKTIKMNDTQALHQYVCDSVVHNDPYVDQPVLYVERPTGLRPSPREGWAVLRTDGENFEAMCPECVQEMLAAKFTQAVESEKAKKQEEEREAEDEYATEVILRNSEVRLYRDTARYLVRAYHRPTDELLFLDVEHADEPGKRASIVEAKRQLVEKVKARPEYKRPLEF